MHCGSWASLLASHDALNLLVLVTGKASPYHVQILSFKQELISDFLDDRRFPRIFGELLLDRTILMF